MCLHACVKTREIKRNDSVSLCVCVLFVFVYVCECGELPGFSLKISLPFASQKHTEFSPLPTDAYFSSVKITEKVEQHAEPKCN